MMSPFELRLLSVVEAVRRGQYNFVIVMARRAYCEFRILRERGLVSADEAERIFSSRVLDGDLSWLAGKSVALVDDTVLTGRTISEAITALASARPDRIGVHAAVACRQMRFDFPKAVNPTFDFSQANLEPDEISAFALEAQQYVQQSGYPYFVDFPVLKPVDFTALQFEELFALKNWEMHNVTNRVQAQGGISVFSGLPRSVESRRRILTQLAPGYPVEAFSSLKIRAYAKSYGIRRRVRFMPKMVLAPTSGKWFDSCVAQTGLEDSNDDGRVLLKQISLLDKARWVSYLGSCALWKVFESDFGLGLAEEKFRLDGIEATRHHRPDLHEQVFKFAENPWNWTLPKVKPDGPVLTGLDRTHTRQIFESYAAAAMGKSAEVFSLTRNHLAGGQVYPTVTSGIRNLLLAWERPKLLPEDRLEAEDYRREFSGITAEEILKTLVPTGTRSFQQEVAVDLTIDRLNDAGLLIPALCATHDGLTTTEAKTVSDMRNLHSEIASSLVVHRCYRGGEATKVAREPRNVVEGLSRTELELLAELQDLSPAGLQDRSWLGVESRNIWPTEGADDGATPSEVLLRSLRSLVVAALAKSQRSGTGGGGSLLDRLRQLLGLPFNEVEAERFESNAALVLEASISVEFKRHADENPAFASVLKNLSALAKNSIEQNDLLDQKIIDSPRLASEILGGLERKDYSSACSSNRVMPTYRLFTEGLEHADAIVLQTADFKKVIPSWSVAKDGATLEVVRELKQKLAMGVIDLWAFDIWMCTPGEAGVAPKDFVLSGDRELLFKTCSDHGWFGSSK